jgi:hypothetical protein
MDAFRSVAERNPPARTTTKKLSSVVSLELSNFNLGGKEKINDKRKGLA